MSGRPRSPRRSPRIWAGRPVEAWLGDIASTKAEAAYARKHLKKWMRRRRVSLPLSSAARREAGCSTTRSAWCW